MRRRHLLIVAVVLGVVAGAVWSLTVWRHYLVIRQLVGVWLSCPSRPGELTRTLFLRPDGRYDSGIVIEPLPADHPSLLFWSVHGQQLVVDVEARRVHPLLRP